MPSTITDRLNGLTTSVAVKAPCRAATTVNITLSGEQTIDGVAVVSGDRVLVKNQTSAVNNGIYKASTGAWTRAADFDGSLDSVGGTQVHVISGTVNATTYWRVAGSSTAIVIGTDAITIEPGGLSDSAAHTFQAAGAGASSRTVRAVLRDLSNFMVTNYGAVGDGVTDDTASIQKAIDAAEVAGGNVIFPDGLRFLVTAKLTVSSTYPVNLIGNQSGHHYDADDTKPAIVIGAAMTYVIEYAAPSSRTEHGSGVIRGLAFIDPTSPDNAAAGTRTVTAALHLKDFGLGLVENCTFQWIKGSAIKTDYCVMSTIRGCRIRYCGDTANLTRSVVLLGGTNSTYPTQSFILEDTRVEVCYSTWYVYASDNTGAITLDVTIRGCKLEASPTYPNSLTGLLYLSIVRYEVQACWFNNTTTTFVHVDTGGRGTIHGCHWIASGSAATSLKIDGAHNIVSNCHFLDNSTGLSVHAVGTNTLITGNEFYRSGGVYFQTGLGGIFAGNKISGPTRSAGYFLTTDGQAIVSGNSFTNNGETLNVGGIIAYSADTISGNFFPAWPGQICIRRESADAMIWGNGFGSVGTAYSEATPGTTAFIAGGLGFQKGGAVTQLTNKATAVTLNQATGQITMDAAALAAAAVVSFTLNNTTITATDQIIVTHVSGGTIGEYLVSGRATGAGTATVYVKNTSAGSLSEAIVLKFSVIKAPAT